MEQRTVDTIIADLKEKIESRKPIERKYWLDMAFYLAILRIDEAKLLNQMKQGIAKQKLTILGGQEKKNVGAAEIEVEAMDMYSLMKDQEEKLYSVDEAIRVAKHSAEEF